MILGYIGPIERVTTLLRVLKLGTQVVCLKLNPNILR